MLNAHERYPRLCLSALLTWTLAVGACDDDDGAASPTSGGTSTVTGGESSGGVVASGGQVNSGGVATTGGQATSGGASGGTQSTGGTPEQTHPPEMPRDPGPPDGVYCESTFRPSPETCAVGSRCCPNDTSSEVQVCMDEAAACRPCAGLTCAQLLCDGPEDCSGGQFCCYANQGACKNNPEDCTPATEGDGNWPFMNVECRSRCVNDQRDVDHGVVVCKDDRDCPGAYVVGRCKALNLGAMPYGLKACIGP